MLYRKLRGKMKEHDCHQDELGAALGLCGVSISQRLLLKTGWRVDEAYKVLEFFGIPPEELPAYFPPGGLPLPEREEKKRDKKTLAALNQVKRMLAEIEGAG